MKKFNLLLVLALLGFMGCQKKNDEQKEEVKTSAQTTVVTEDTLGYRTADLEDDVKSAKTIPDVEYSKDPAGTSKKIPRAYDNAPPMIPHDVTDMLPIVKGNNACLNCHTPEIAVTMGATPIPPTHFTNYRPTTELKGDKLVKEGKVVSPDGDIGNTGDIVIAKAKKLGDLYQGRFNCSQCHAPQAQTKPLVENTFEGDFRNPDAKHKSTLFYNIDEGVEADF
jgi:cytochrome c-type protein NapB